MSSKRKKTKRSARRAARHKGKHPKFEIGSNLIIGILTVLFMIFQLVYLVHSLGFSMNDGAYTNKDIKAVNAQDHGGFNILKLFEKKKTIKVTGAVASGHVSLNILPSTGCQIDLYPNWNFISLCADADNKSITSVLETIDGEYEYVQRWDPSTQLFELYSIYRPTNPFDSFEENYSYFIYMKSSQILAVVGNDFGDMNLPMVYSWNAPIYPYLFTVNITRYLETMPGQYEYMQKWNATSQLFDLFSIYRPVNPFNNISKGEGQFIYISNLSGTTLRYNKTDLES